MRGHGALIDLLRRALVPSPPIEASEGGYIAAGYDVALDDLRDAGAGGRRAIAALEAEFRQKTGIAALKIRHNGVLGYHVEVPARSADALMKPESGFTHRQTLAGVVRFNTPELHDVASKVAQAGAHALAAEAAHLEELTAAALASREGIAATADALARLDVASGLAERAVEGGWVRPELVDHACFDVTGGRHPVVEAAVARSGERFVANDCSLSESSRLWLVTGPNMGGKSTFLRQNAVIAVLAQAGSYVPATHAKIGLVDRLFSRVGASDNLARGRSTFMVEMVETAAILAQATPRSFVILDEVGRGTSTYDGLAIAWAVVEAIHEDNRCRCLFATHYHELTRLAERCEALSLHHVRAREWKGELVLLHEVSEGPADRSYGLAVARLAGMPPTTVARAKAVLAKLEAGRAKTGGLAAGLDDLPLFAAAAQIEEEQCDAIRAEVEKLDVDALSPREALDALYKLKALAREGERAPSRLLASSTPAQAGAQAPRSLKRAMIVRGGNRYPAFDDSPQLGPGLRRGRRVEKTNLPTSVQPERSRRPRDNARRHAQPRHVDFAQAERLPKTGDRPALTSRTGKWGASVARCSPYRWIPLLLPGGVRPRYFGVMSGREALNYAAIASASLSLALVYMGRCGGPIPNENSAFQHTSILVRPRQKRCPSTPPFMVEPPGTAPGPLRLLLAAVYRHSRVKPGKGI
ncbi:hypothetical protein GCM10020258_11460 [Sphingomonas yabuuchiae]